jgi:hypothetical protein
MNGWETCRAAMNLAAAEFWATGTMAGLWTVLGILFASGLALGWAVGRWRR